MEGELRALRELCGDMFWRILLLRVFAAAPDDSIYQRRLTQFYLFDGAAHCRSDFGRVFDRTLGIPADAFGDMGEVRRRAFEIHANVSARRIGATLVRHVNLV